MKIEKYFNWMSNKWKFMHFYIIDVPQARHGQTLCYHVKQDGHVTRKLIKLMTRSIPPSYLIRKRRVVHQWHISTLLPSYFYVLSLCWICSLPSSWTILTTSQETPQFWEHIILTSLFGSGRNTIQARSKYPVFVILACVPVTFWLRKSIIIYRCFQGPNLLHRNVWYA